MNRLILNFVFLVSMISSLDFAHAQRVIGNGGGLAELKIIYINQHLASFLRPCLSSANPCELTDQETLEFKAIIDHHPTESREARITFALVGEQTSKVTTSPRLGSEIKISSDALYTSDEIPRSVGELSALVLAARWSHVSATTITRLLEKSISIFSSFDERMQSLDLGTEDGSVRLHVSRIQFRGTLNALVLLEDRVETFDLSEQVQLSLPCEQLVNWRLENMRAFSKDQEIYGMLDASATCGSHHRSGTVVIRFETNQNRIVPETTAVAFRNGF